MAWPTDDLNTTNTDQGTDNPSLARAMLNTLVLRVKEMIGARGAVNGVCDLDAASKVPVGRLPTGTTASNVAVGNHGHLGVYQPIGDYQPATPDASTAEMQAGIQAANRMMSPDDVKQAINALAAGGVPAGNTVGTVVTAHYRNNDTTIRPMGHTVAGSALSVAIGPQSPTPSYPYFSSGLSHLSGVALGLSGTWECLLTFRNGFDGVSYHYAQTTWRRIS